MAIVGKTTDGTNVQTFSGDRMYVNQVTPSSSGTVVSGWGRVRVTSASTSEVRMVIYSDSASEPDDFLALSDEVIVDWTTSTLTRFQFSGANKISLTDGTPYWVGFWFDDPGTPSFEMKRDNTSNVVRFRAEAYPGGGTPTTPWTSDGSSNGPLNAYLLYAEDVPELSVDHTTDALLRKQDTKTHTTSAVLMENPGAVTAMHVQAWFYPGPPANNADEEYSDGRRIDVLKPEYYTLASDGTLTLLEDVDAATENAYSESNATDVLANCRMAFFTVSGSTAGLEAMLGDVSNPIDSTKRANFISTLSTFCDTIDFHGVDIDIEGYGDWDATTTSRFYDLMDDLGDALHALGKKLSVCVPAIWNDATGGDNEWDGLDSQAQFNLTYEAFNSLAVDYICIMAYDYQWDWGSQKPVQPLAWLDDIITWAKSKITDHDKIVIGIPSYGYSATNAEWSYDVDIKTKTETSAVSGFSDAVRDLDLLSNGTDYTSGENFFVNGGNFYSFADYHTLRIKAMRVASNGIYKISIWHLGGNDWYQLPLILEHTTDAYLEVGLTTATITHTTDALLRAVDTVTHTTDSFLRDRITLTHTTDALLRKQNTITHTTDGLLRESTTLTHTTDALLREQDILTHTTDGLLRATGTVTHTTDAVLRTQLTVEHTTDAFLRDRLTVAHTTDALLQGVNTRTHTTDTLLRAENTLVHTTDALVREQFTRTHTTDALKRGRYTEIHTTDGLLRGRYTEIHNTDTLLRGKYEVSHSTDALLRSENTVQHTTDALLRETNTVQHNTNTLLRSRNALEHATDALKRARTAIVHTTDAILRKQSTVQHTTSGVLRAVETISHDTDAVLHASVTVTHTTDAFLRKQTTVQHTTDARILFATIVKVTIAGTAVFDIARTGSGRINVSHSAETIDAVHDNKTINVSILDRTFDSTAS